MGDMNDILEDAFFSRKKVSILTKKGQTIVGMIFLFEEPYDNDDNCSVTYITDDSGEEFVLHQSSIKSIKYV